MDSNREVASLKVVLSLREVLLNIIIIRHLVLLHTRITWVVAVFNNRLSISQAISCHVSLLMQQHLTSQVLVNGQDSSSFINALFTSRGPSTSLLVIHNIAKGRIAI